MCNIQNENLGAFGSLASVSVKPCLVGIFYLPLGENTTTVIVIKTASNDYFFGHFDKKYTETSYTSCSFLKPFLS